jgi:putative ABC transport system permease protein
MGREFTSDEDRPGGPDAVILGYSFWKERLGAPSDVLSRTITISGQPRQIVGIAPPGFDFPRGARIWTPVKNDDRACGRSCVYLNGVGRLAPGISVAAARKEMDAISRRLEEQYPADNNNLLIAVRTLSDETVGSVRNAMVLLFGAVVMVLLIACANIANLLLVRGTSRRSDVAVRAALGAARSRLVMHLLAESVVLAVAGGTLGVVIAAWSVDALKQLAPPSIPRLAEVAFDGPTFVFALSLIGLTTLLFGLGPAVQLSRVPLNSALGSRGEVGVARRRWGRAGLLAAEVGLSVVLLLGAGLLVRTVAALNAIDPGWRPDGVSTFMVFLPPVRYQDRAATVRAHDEIAARLAALPGTESVGRISGLPLGRSEDVMSVYRLDRPRPRPGQEPNALYRTADPDYFRTMGIALMSGRSFTPQDREGTPGAVIISRRMADLFYPGEDPIGRPISVAGRDAVVVGIAADVRSASIESEPQPEMYVAHAQAGTRAMTFVVKSRQQAARVLSDARAVVQSVDPDLPLIFPETMQQVLDRATARPRFYMLLLGLFAVLAVSLAAVGVYGVVAYAVSQRTREIGVRMALGAGRAQVVRLMLWQGFRPAAAGLVAGLAGAFAMGRAISGELYGVRPHDPATFAAVTLLLLAVVLTACVLPATRATRVPPAAALRGE